MPICRIYTPTGKELTHFVPDDIDSKEITVGRSSNCTIPLKSAEATLSREHFVLKHSGHSWMIYDTSKGGIFKNCERISEAELAPGDVIRFGQYFFCFGEKAVPSDYELTWKDQDTHLPARAVLWQGMNNIGTSRDNSVCIQSDRLARFHGRISVHGDAIVYSNRTDMTTATLNGAEVEGDTPLHDGDVLAFGPFQVTLVKTMRGVSSMSSMIMDEPNAKHNYKLKNRKGRDGVAILMYCGLAFFVIALVFIIYFVVTMG